MYGLISRHAPGIHWGIWETMNLNYSISGIMFVCALQKDVYQKVVYLMTLACADSWVSTLDCESATLSQTGPILNFNMILKNTRKF